MLNFAFMPDWVDVVVIDIDPDLNTELLDALQDNE
jgi:hypothetical protein